MATRKAKEKKPYLQWSKKQSGVVTGFFIFYFIFIAICICYQPKAADALVRLSMAVAGVMGANLAMYGGTSSFEKYIAGKYGDFMQYKKGEFGQDNEEKEEENSEEDIDNG